MNVSKPLTDYRVFELIKEQLDRVTADHGYEYHSAEEMNGVLAEEAHELLHAVHEGKGHVTTDVLGELIDIAVVCIRGARSYIHNGVNNEQNGAKA